MSTNLILDATLRDLTQVPTPEAPSSQGPAQRVQNFLFSGRAEERPGFVDVGQSVWNWFTRPREAPSNGLLLATGIATAAVSYVVPRICSSISQLVGFGAISTPRVRTVASVAFAVTSIVNCWGSKSLDPEQRTEDLDKRRKESNADRASIRDVLNQVNQATGIFRNELQKQGQLAPLVTHLAKAFLETSTLVESATKIQQGNQTLQQQFNEIESYYKKDQSALKEKDAKIKQLKVEIAELKRKSVPSYTFPSSPQGPSYPPQPPIPQFAPYYPQQSYQHNQQSQNLPNPFQSTQHNNLYQGNAQRSSFGS